MSVRNKLRSALEQGPATGGEGGLLGSDFVRSMPFWVPPTLLMGLFVYGGILWNFVISLTDFSGIVRPEYSLSNFDFEMYQQMLTDPVFWNTAGNTFILMVVFTLLCLAVGLVLAIIVDNLLRAENFYRTIFLLPFALSFVVTGVFWQWMYNPNFGVIATVLRMVGLGWLNPNWLGDPRLKLFSVIIALVWQYSGYAMVIYLAGLRTIPQDHYEAAQVDGAGFFTMYRRVIIPQLSSASVSIAVVVMVFALNAFTWLFVVFGINPGPSADILGVMMYRTAFRANRWAYGAAIGTAQSVVPIVPDC
ncbi:MAG: carbohydrate ABC transporter permease [Haloarculaceae archaeon]